MKIKLSELKKLIREAAEDTITVYSTSGELIDTLTKADASKMASLGNKQISGNEIFLDEDEFELVQDELERNRLAIQNDSGRGTVTSEEAFNDIKKNAFDAGYEWAGFAANTRLDPVDFASDLVDGLSWEDDYQEALIAVADELDDMDLSGEDPEEALDISLKDEFVSGADTRRQETYK